MEGLIAHCGSTKVDREFLRGVATPEAVGIWKPIPHYDAACCVVEQAMKRGFAVTKEEYALDKAQAKLFGVVKFANQDGDLFTETTKMIGFRHSHDKSMAFSITVGKTVIVCDNMAFGGEMVMKHKHTSGFDFCSQVDTLFNGIDDRYGALDEGIAELKGQPLTPFEARSLIIDTADADIIAPKYIMDVVKEYEAPTFESFKPGNKWSLYNAFTHVMKQFPTQRFDESMRALSAFFALSTRTTPATIIDAEVVV